jgi:DNA repair exonuclease SbcCD nuclease subunit
MYHAEQDRAHMFGEIIDDEVYLRREIDAQKYLISVTERYKIPSEEVNVTEKNLELYEKRLEELLARRDRNE